MKAFSEYKNIIYQHYSLSKMRDRDRERKKSEWKKDREGVKA